MKHLQTIIALVLAASTLPACSTGSDRSSSSVSISGYSNDGDSHRTAARTLNLSGYTAISTSSAIDIYYTQTSSYSPVTVHAPARYIDNVKVTVSNGTLKAYMQGVNNIRLRDKERIIVSLSAPALSAFSASSSGDIYINDGLIAPDGSEIKFSTSSSGDIKVSTIKASTVNLSASSSGDIKIDELSCRVLNASATSSGDIKIKGGMAQKAFLKASSSGDIKASQFQVKEIDARASSAGDIECSPTESISYKESSSGDVKFNTSVAVRVRKL